MRLTQIYSLVIASPCSLNLGLKLPSACHRRAICLSVPVPSMTLKSLCPLKPSCERVTPASVLHSHHAKRNIKSTGLQGCPGRRKGLSFQGQGSLRLPPMLEGHLCCAAWGAGPLFPLLLESPVFLVGLRKGVERALLLRAEAAWHGPHTQGSAAAWGWLVIYKEPWGSIPAAPSPGGTAVVSGPACGLGVLPLCLSRVASQLPTGPPHFTSVGMYFRQKTGSAVTASR